MYTVSEDFGGFAAGFPHPWIRFVPLFPPRFFCSWVTAWVKTLSGALGHYSAGFTLNTYTHATAQMKQDAADTIGGVISQQMR